MKTVAPQHMLPSYYMGMEKQLIKIFYDILFYPLMDVLRDVTPQTPGKRGLAVQNEMRSALRDAIRSGRVQFVNGAFTGKFSAAISNEIRAMGGLYEDKSKRFRVSNPPAWVVAEAAAYSTTAKRIHDVLKKKLNQIQIDLQRSVEKNKVDALPTIDRYEAGFKKAAKVIEVNPELQPHSKQILAQDYTDNMALWIQKFAAQEITALREVVEDNANQGYRYDALIDGIKKRYRVTTNKAKFLARQETSLYMSKFHEQQFAEAGIQQYIWSTSHDERVRHSHKHLDGRVFSFDDPPITDPATGAKNNPGEDFNCRCVAIAVFAEDKKGAEGEAREYREMVHEADALRERQPVAE